MIISKPKAVIFDWDNTLVDTWELMHASLNHTLTQAGLPSWTLIEVKQKLHGSMREHFPKMFGEKYEEMRQIYYSYYMQNHLQYLSPLGGAVAVLRLLQEQGIHIMLVSNKRGDILRKEVDFLHWREFFQSIIGAEDAAQDKPSPLPAQKAITDCRLNMAHIADVWFVGDTIVDMQCAVNAGCQPVLFGDSTNPNEVALLRRDFHHVRNHYELLDLLCSPCVRISA